MVAHLFSSHALQAAPQRLGKSSSVTRLYKAHTVAAKFQQSLLDLVEKMERWAWQRVGPVSARAPLGPPAASARFPGASHCPPLRGPGATPCL